MRAVVYDRYGGPERLHLEDLSPPTPGPSQVLIEVVATAVNLSDWESLTGKPAYARLGGLFAPRRRVLGSDFAGRVVGVGADVTGFGVGDEVYGDNLQLKGGFAEYAVAPESVLAIKPPSLSFAQAAAVPQSGAIAVQAIAKARAGERMLINGAGGGTGAFAIQLAKASSLHVTGVDTAAKLDFIRDLGADAAIDFCAEDFTRTGPYNVIIDLVASRSVFAYRRALAPGGRYFMVGGTTRALFRLLTLGSLVGMLSGRRLGVLFVREGPAQFRLLTDRILAGDVSVRIDRTFALHDAAEALEHHGRGLALGKVVVVIRGE